ncbi:MAG TPA: aminodeoxychorismate synthase component I [Acidimicrobiaceae bacterium]|nr:aminodeoxychorismate synthase, component I [Acidimicrobiaceae bacterium]MDP7258574.1 aminodeoxychorismate synthase component I [Acidimicrobiales bacterium]HCV35771.1 aminodeoxychorismate synthase component I [Acidimicrobiaceae bacterium]HJO80617.1 aminodeoxychorismate synthase component I [Acidimicrobiales bacterium]
MSQPEVRSALIQYPLSGKRHWLEFDRPVDTILANQLYEVPTALLEAEKAAANGYWVVGMVSYDAGPAFDDAIRAARMKRVPLVSFGIFDSPLRSDGPSAKDGYEVGPWTPNRSRPAYLTSVRTIRELIAAGETYQVNFSIRLRSPFHGDPLSLFTDLVRAQRADHAAFLDMGDRAVCSVSPELFVHKDGKHLTSRPMKGTIGRHPDPDWDALAATHLARSEKDLAENTMIVDMVRNDLGRIAATGSVRVSALHTIETYPTLHTMTSTVEAESAVGPVEVFSAMFPAASITGAPKVRTTEIIEALEGDGRGVYTGAVGAIAPDGTMEFNIAIRTVWVDRSRCVAEYGVGGGIVWDSDPAEELRETEQKARVLGRARADFRLLETMIWTPIDGVRLRERHLDRLALSANHFGFTLDIQLVNRLLDGVERDSPCLLRLLSSSAGSVELEIHDVFDSSPTPWLVPLDSKPVHSEHEFLFHKTTLRETYDAARSRFPDSPDVLLCNERGELTETTTGNLVVELDGALVTPPVSCGLLPGTQRAQLVADGEVAERPLTRADLERSTGTWMVNSVRGWVPIRIMHDAATAQIPLEQANPSGGRSPR